MHDNARLLPCTVRHTADTAWKKSDRETGISPNHINDLEHGRRNPSVETLKRLIVPLGITLSELFNEDDQVSYLSENERELVENYRNLPDEKGKLLLEMSKALNK